MLPDPQDKIPAWKLILMSISIVIYQNLDNMDGKQARKTSTYSIYTESSSPLGMLFDHGSDTVTAFLIAGQFMKILQMSYPLQLVSIYIFIMSLYFFAMWSQYTVGFFKLGRVNPVDEGLPIFAISCLVATQYDLSFVNNKHIFGTFTQQVVGLFSILTIPQSIFMTKDIFTKSIIPKSQTIFMPLLYISVGLAMLLVYWSIPELTGQAFYTFYYAVMFMWSRNMINIQLYHITKQKYRVFNRGTLSFLILCIIYIVFSRIFEISAEKYFLAVCIIQGIIFFEFVIRVLNQGAAILGIRLFSLKPGQIKSA